MIPADPPPDNAWGALRRWAAAWSLRALIALFLVLIVVGLYHSHHQSPDTVTTIDDIAPSPSGQPKAELLYELGVQERAVTNTSGLDIIGPCSSDASIHLCAFDGKTGRLIWESSVNVEGATAESDDSRVLILDPLGSLYVLSLHTGKTIDTIKLPEPGKEVCLDPERPNVASVFVKQGNVGIDVNLVTKVAQYQSFPTNCYTRRCSKLGTSYRCHLINDEKDPSGGRLSVITDGIDRIGIGERDDGEVYAWVVDPSASSKEPDKATWKQLLYATGAGRSLNEERKANANDQALTLAGGRFFFNKLDGRGLVLTALQISSGDVLWERTLPDALKAEAVLSGKLVFATPSHVYLGGWGRTVEVLDAATGELLFKLNK